MRTISKSGDGNLKRGQRDGDVITGKKGKKDTEKANE